MRRHRLLLLSSLVLVARPATAADPLILRGSPDIHVDQTFTVLRPGDVAADLEVLLPGLIDLGPLPDGADVIAYAPAGPGSHFFVLGHTLVLPGGVTAGPRDVVRWDGSAYTVELDGAEIGLPDGTVIDAIAFDPATDTPWFSFEAPIDLFGTVLREADVVDAQTLAK